MPAEMSKMAVINVNNIFAPSFFQSLCEIVSDYFDTLVFSSGAALLQKYSSAQNNQAPNFTQ